MYNFIDVNEVLESVVLPSEALKINGEYIENQISGYRTLNVQGREALSPDVESYTTGVRDGARLKSTRFPERLITVTYAIHAESNEAFREAYNRLGQILNVKEAQLIFGDEPDKFFVGTPCAIAAVEPGRNSVVGKFEILCTDPFKYSVVEYEAYQNEDENSIFVDYGGTYKAYPILEADFYKETEVAEDGETARALTGTGDCGYVAFFNENEKIIQLGDPDEVDGTDEYAPSQTMINQTFMSETAWGTTAKNLWTMNGGTAWNASNVLSVGSVAMGRASSTTTTSYHSGTTSGTACTAAGSPNLKVSYSTKNRTANSVTVVLAAQITAVLTIEPYQWVAVTIQYAGTGITIYPKSKDDPSGLLRGNSRTASKTITISGLEASQTSIPISAEIQVIENYNPVMRFTAYGNIRISQYSSSSTTYSTYYLTPNTYGTAADDWHGPSITRSIGQDSAGNYGATDFTLTYKQKLCIGSNTGAQNQTGSFRMNITDENNQNVAGIWIYKNTSGKTGNLVFQLNGKRVDETPIDLHCNNTFFGSSEASVCTTTVTKSGGTVTFAVGSYQRQFYVAELTDIVSANVTFSFEQCAEQAVMSYNGLYWAKFVKNHINPWKDIPNKFSANDVLEADCKSGEIYLNGIKTPALGALGNDWEGFFLSPGFNEIGFSYSDWVESKNAPLMKVRYREVFL